MATSKSGKKSVIQAETRRVFNLRRLRAMKGVLKEIALFVGKKEKKSAEELLPKAYKAIDKAAKGGIIKKHNASHKKAKIARDIANVA